jgi:hypothetical protein
MQPIDKAQDRLGRRFATPIQKALNASWNIDDVITHWRHLAPESLMTRKQVADWLRINLVFKNADLNKTLASLYATATVFGIDAADYRLRKARKRNKAGIGSFNWDNWQPGNRPAALLVNPPEGLARRLAKRYRTIKELNDTTVDRIGTVLAEGLAAGISPRDVASGVAGELIDARTDWAETLEERLKQMAQDNRRAEVIARTEMNRAVWDEKVDRYAEMGVEMVEWVVVSPCDDCAENDGAQVLLGEPFPNGWTSIDDSHPNCNCTITPVLDDLFTFDRPGDRDDIELSASPDEPKVGVPSSLDVEEAIVRLDMLPNLNRPDLKNPYKFVASPWPVEPVPRIDPHIWDTAELVLINIDELYSTNEFMKRKNVKKHIENMGQSVKEFRSYAMVYEQDDKPIIIDGHHRLMSLWLLGLDKAPVWLVKE